MHTDSCRIQKRDEYATLREMKNIQLAEEYSRKIMEAGFLIEEHRNLTTEENQFVVKLGKSKENLEEQGKLLEEAQSYYRED